MKILISYGELSIPQKYVDELYRKTNGNNAVKVSLQEMIKN
jgi:hypothetical protein